MDNFRYGEDNARYEESYRSSEKITYDDKKTARENAGYVEYASREAERSGGTKAVSHGSASSKRKKKGTSKLVAAVLLGSGAAVVAVTAVMAMVSIALIGMTIGADAVTAEIKIDNPSGVELIATLSNKLEYYECKIPGSGRTEVTFGGLNEATEYVFAVRAASGGSVYYSQNVATNTKILYAFDENSAISFHTAELKYIIDESVAGYEYTVEMREHGMDKTLAEYTLDPLTHATFASGPVSDTRYDATLVDASGNGVYTHTFTTEYAPSRITSVT